MPIKIYAKIEESVDERFSKTTPVTIELDDSEISALAYAIFNAEMGDLFGRAKSLIEKLKHLSIQSLF